MGCRVAGSMGEAIFGIYISRSLQAFLLIPRQFSNSSAAMRSLTNISRRKFPQCIPSMRPIPPTHQNRPQSQHHTIRKQMIPTRKLLLGVQLLKVSVAELVSADEPSILGITNVAIHICQLDQPSNRNMREIGPTCQTPGSISSWQAAQRQKRRLTSVA